MFHKTIMLAALLALIALPSLAADKPDFSGEWKANLSKSDFGQMPAPDKIVRKIEHKEPAMKVTTTQVGQMGERTNEMQLTTDGKEFIIKFGPAEMKATAKWDGATLVTVSKGDFQGNEFTMTDKWSLSGDGKILTSERTFSSSQGEMTSKIVFEK